MPPFSVAQGALEQLWARGLSTKDHFKQTKSVSASSVHTQCVPSQGSCSNAQRPLQSEDSAHTKAEWPHTGECCEHNAGPFQHKVLSFLPASQTSLCWPEPGWPQWACVAGWSDGLVCCCSELARAFGWGSCCSLAVFLITQCPVTRNGKAPGAKPSAFWPSWSPHG